MESLDPGDEWRKEDAGRKKEDDPPAALRSAQDDLPSSFFPSSF